MNSLDPDDKHFYYGNMKELAAVAIPFTQYLSERYGGKWKHHKRSRRIDLSIWKDARKINE